MNGVEASERMASDEAANMHGSIVSSDRGVTAG